MPIRRNFAIITALLLTGLLSGCLSNPQYRDISDNDSGDSGSNLWGEVNFRINPHYSGMRIPCIAVMPFSLDESSKDSIHFQKSASATRTQDSMDAMMDLPGSESTSDTKADTTSDAGSGELDPNESVYPDELNAADKASMLRRLFYGYMASSGVKLVALDKIDNSVKGLDSQDDIQSVGKAVQCDWLLKGRITDFSMQYVGVFASLSVGADMELVRASDGKLLWEGNHVARSQAGALPLTPVDLAMGTLKASLLLNADELESVASDLARRLVHTMPLEPNDSLVRAARHNHFYRVAARSLNLRSGPGTDYRVQKVLSNSDRVTLLDGATDKSWYRVMARDGTEGYVSRRYLQPLALGNVLMSPESPR